MLLWRRYEVLLPGGKQLLSPLQCKLKQNVVFALLKLILKFFLAVPKLALIWSIGLTPNTKDLFLQLSVRDNELLSTVKIPSAAF